MAVLPEAKIVACLDICLGLSRDLLPALLARGTAEADPRMVEAFNTLVGELERERSNDAYLSDESWDWIWKGKTGYNYLQLYGRLAWINMQLFDLL